MKLQTIIPEGVYFSLGTKYIRETTKGEKKWPSYERFFEECVETCKELNIDLRSKWSLFFKECESNGINAKKMMCTEPRRAAPVKMRPMVPDTEDDFWVVEKDVVSQPAKWDKLGYIRNPWADFMFSLPEYEQKGLYFLYLKAHQDTKIDPNALDIYHEKMREAFNI